MAAEYLVLIGVEMDAVDVADANDVPASKNAQPISAAIAAYAGLTPADFPRASANFSAIVPAGVPVGGGATMRIGGTGMSGSIGALRIARTRDAMPWAECEALC